MGTFTQLVGMSGRGGVTLALGVFFASTSQAEICKPWSNPGANKNTQWPSISTAHYRPDLSQRVEDKAYDEIVVIKGGRIYGESSGRSYSNLRDMHYGNGKWCKGLVELPPITENEFGFVYCTPDNRCVIDWFICHNISQVDRDEQPTRPEALVPPVYAEQPSPYSEGEYSEFASFSAFEYSYSGFSSQMLGGGGGGGARTYEQITPIPEPATYLYILVGLGVIYVSQKRKANRKITL